MKILFIRFSSIGDIVLTTPVIRCVKEQVRDAEIHFLLKKSFAPVLEHNPHIDKRIYFADNFSETIEALREENYDLVIDLQKNFRSFRIRQLLGVKSFTFDKLNVEKWLRVNLRINLLPRVHIVDRYLYSVRSLGVVNDGRGLDYYITSQEEAVVQTLPETHRNGYTAWVIGARHYTKRLPPEKMLSLARKIDTPVVLLGDNRDAPAGEQLVREAGNRFYNACGKFSLNESAAFVKHSRKVITHDTGLMHIAAAFKRDIVSVWGNTVPEFGMYPYVGTGVPGAGRSLILEVKNLSCRPCSKIGYTKCPKGHFRCMHGIDEAQLVAFLKT